MSHVFFPLLQIKYAMGAEREVRLRSSGIPIGVTPAKSRAIMEKGFVRQPVLASDISEIAVVQACVLLYVKKFGSTNDVNFWEEFFKKVVPEEELNKDNCPRRHDSYLHKLYAEYGGPARRKDRTHLNPRATISDYSEAMVFPEAPWNQSERDAAAQYAVSSDSRLLYTKADVKRVVKRKKKGEGKEKDNTKSVSIVEPEKAIPKEAKRRGRKPKQEKKATAGPKRRRKMIELGDDSSVDTHSTAETSFTYSMKSADDSDLGSGFPSEIEDTSIASNFSTSDITVLPKRMKHKELGLSYLQKVGKRFIDLGDGNTYRVVSVCRFDDPAGIIDSGRPLAYQLCFKYINDDLELSDLEDSGDMETSLCFEMMDADCEWVQWLE